MIAGQAEAPRCSLSAGNTYRGFLRSGALLDEKQKARLRDINREHSLLALKFDDNLLAETNDSYVVIDNEADLAGLPESAVAMGEETAKAMSMEGKWVFSTQRPSWPPFLQYAENRDLRSRCIRLILCAATATTTRTTRPILQKLLTYREERYRMLGYKTPAQFFWNRAWPRPPKPSTNS